MAPQQGLKKLLIIRVDFPDFPDASPSELAISNAMTGVDRYFRSNSFGRILFSWAITPELRMPLASSNYTAGFNITGLRTDALAAARAAGFNPDLFEYDMVAFQQIGLPFLGWGNFGRGLWIQEFAGFPVSAATIAHEIGHNFGLEHAHAWVSPSTIGEGQKVEGGNPFDVMGGGGVFSSGSPSADFNAKVKHALGWLPNDNLHSITTNGVYRIFAIDNGLLDASRKYAISVNAGVQQSSGLFDYWIEWRQNFEGARDQALIYWAAQGAAHTSYLLDTTPGSQSGGGDLLDSGVRISRSFTDPNKRITIAPLQSGGVGADRYLDVQVIFNSAIRPPTIQQQPATLSVPTGSPVRLQVFADSSSPMKYYWRRYGSVVPDEPSDAIVFPQITYQLGGDYSVTISNELGSVNSSTATIFVTNFLNLPCHSAAPGLINWWSADQHPLDWIGTNHAQLHGVRYTNGLIGGAFEFNGSTDYVAVPNSPLWGRGQADFTIELWANFASIPSETAFLAQNNGPGHVDKWIFWWNDKQLRFYVVNTGGAIENIGTTVFAPQTNRWYHLAVSRFANTFTFYINGAATSTNTSSISVPQSIGPLTIGHNEGLFFPGRIDDVRIYSRSLNASAIRPIYMNAATGLCLPTNTPAYLQLAGGPVSVDEGSPAQISIHRSGNLNSTVTVSIATVSRSALAGINFMNLQTNLTFLPGQTNLTITLQTLNDGAPGGMKEFNVILGNPGTNAVASATPASILIIDRGCLPIPAGILAWWPGDSPTNRLPAMPSVSLHNGAGYAPGKVGQAFSFDGADDFAEIADPFLYNFAPRAPMSVSLWVNRAAGEGHLIGKRVGCTGGDIIWQIGFSQIQGFVFGGDNGPMWAAHPLPVGVWVHLVATFDGNIRRLYADGALIGSAPGSLGNTNSSRLRIGKAGDCGGFAGKLDEITIFDRALSALEIQGIFVAGDKGVCPPTISNPIEFLEVRQESDGRIRLTARGNIGVTSRLEFSTNFLNGWSSLEPVLFRFDTETLFHQPASHSRGFYRLSTP